MLACPLVNSMNIYFYCVQLVFRRRKENSKTINETNIYKMEMLTFSKLNNSHKQGSNLLLSVFSESLNMLISSQ